MKTELKIEGMSCNHCVNAVKSALTAIDGVASVDVTLDPGHATVEHDPGVQTLTIVNAIEEEGYGAQVK